MLGPLFDYQGLARWLSRYARASRRAASMLSSSENAHETVRPMLVRVTRLIAALIHVSSIRRGDRRRILKGNSVDWESNLSCPTRHRLGRRTRVLSMSTCLELSFHRTVPKLQVAHLKNSSCNVSNIEHGRQGKLAFAVEVAPCSGHLLICACTNPRRLIAHLRVLVKLARRAA